VSVRSVLERQIENDETKFVARPAVIIASVRSGGTFLAHCLSNHPQIFCDRGESLHYRSMWHTHLTTNRAELIYCLTHMQGYRVSMCKLTYQQAFLSEVWQYVAELAHVVWLRRENTIRQAVSVILNQMARRGKIERPQHTFGRVEPICVELEPKWVLKTARALLERDRKAKGRLEGLNLLALTYEEIVGPASTLADGAARRICEFLGVRYIPTLACELTRINPQPLAEMIANWDDVCRAIEASAFAHCLEEDP
jgi:LPS sulfotransferase NodH